MILRKVWQEGEEVYVPVSRQEAEEVVRQGGELLFTDQKEREAFYQAPNRQEENGSEGIPQEINAVHSEEQDGSAEEISDRISKRIEDKFADFRFDSASSAKEKEKNKVARLLRVLPFLEEEDYRELIQEMLAGKESLKDIPLSSVLPYLSDEDCDAVFLKIIGDGKRQFSLANVAPFVSEDCLSRTVDLYLEGKLPEEDMDELYPFLSSKDIKRVFQYIINKKEE